MGGMQTKQITLANLDKFSSILGCSAVAASLRRIPPLWLMLQHSKQKVKVLFVSYGSKEKTETAKANHEALGKLGISNVFYESPGDGPLSGGSWPAAACISSRRCCSGTSPCIASGNH